MNALRYLSFARRGLVRRGAPLHLTVYVTGVCNLRCRHCFHFKEVAAGVPGPELESFEKLAASTQSMGPMLWVSIGGGEPFMRRDLPAIANAFGRRGLRHLAIPTNGLVDRQVDMTGEMADANPDTYLSVSVSFDGPPDIHDEIRQVPGGHAKSMRAVRALQSAKGGGRNLGVGILVTVTSENQHVLAEHLEELVGELEPDNVTINLARGTALDESLLVVDPDRYLEVVATKERLMRSGRLPYFDFPLAKLAVARDRMMYDHVARVARADTSRHLPCTAGSLSAVVFENGEVHPCEILGESMGNLNDVDWDLSALWGSERAGELREEIEVTRCSCTWECAQADNVLFQPRNWPGLAARVLGS